MEEKENQKKIRNEIIKTPKKPEPNELIILNPRLGIRKEQKIQELIDTITELGYEWDRKRQRFYNKEISMAVRTQGLDIFDPELFKRTHKIWSNPNFISGARLRQTYIPKIFILLVIDILAGWIFLSTKIWVLSLVTLIMSLIIVQRIAHKRIHLMDRNQLK